MLEIEFRALVSRYTSDKELIATLWKEIETAYGDIERKFHNLSHLEQIINLLLPFQSQIEDWDTLLFAAYYHDFVYDVEKYVTENNNEDKSAEKAEEVLKSIGYPFDKIERCKQHILATKKHELSADADTNFLTDADLSILGQSTDEYEVYHKNIRKEYFIYPDAIYHAGRQKVLQQFLQRKRLYKTDSFFLQYESQARENIKRELELISFS